MKKAIVCITLFALLLLTFCSCMGDGTQNQGTGGVSSGSTLGDYQVRIDSCRLATDYKGDPIIIVKYKFTNNADEPACFAWTFEYEAYQNGVGLNECYVASDSANYSADNQTKQIKNGVSLYVEVAYNLDDTTTDVDIEVSELFSFSNKKVTKKFSIR